jgi:hypothetical protein
MLYKVLLMALQTKGISFENRKTLVSDIQEALPALTR